MKRSVWFWLTWILVLAFALRLGSAIAWETFLRHRPDSPVFFFGDSDSYWQLGKAIAEGAPYEHDPVRHWKIFRMPGYPALLAPLFLLNDAPPVFWARVENILFGVLTVLLTALTARSLFRDDRAALIAALLAAVSPELLFQSVCVLSEEPFCALNLLLTLLLFRLVRSRFAPELGALAGIAAAGTVYLRPDWLYWVPFAAAGLLLLVKDGRRFLAGNFRRAAAAGCCFLLCFAAALSPWWIRNGDITGRFVPTTLQMGASLYDGLSPTADGSSNMEFVDLFRNEVLMNPNGEYWEVQLDQVMKDASFRWVKSHPADLFRLAGVKFCRLWNVFPNEPAFSSVPAKLLICVSFLPILLFAVIGALRLRHRSLWLFLVLPAVYVTLLHIVFVASLRYRSPVLPGLIILAAWGAVTVFRRDKVITAENKEP